MVTALPLQKGLVMLTAGEFSSVTIVHCNVAGTLTLKWDDSTTTDYPMLAGEDVFCYDAASVTLGGGGTFTLAKA